MIGVQNLSKSYGPQVVFDDVSFLMTPGERLGFVGRNGYGKTTLFRILLGEEQADDGRIVMPKGYRIGHLSQHLHFEQPTILDEVCTVLGERVEEERYRAEAALMGLGFSREELARPASSFSGGYQIRVNLARVLVEAPNLLLLDEPTNYLDITSVRWLQRFLREWPDELIIITHDRQFMNSVTTHSMAVHRRKLRRMEGPVEKLFDQIATEEEVYEKTRSNDEKKRRQEERFIERFRSKASKASLVQSRIKQLERRGRMEALDADPELEFSFRAAPFHASTMMTVNELAFGFPGGPTLMKDISFTIDKGDRIGIIGPNGKGKTTLLNLLAREFAAQAGELKQNPNTKIAYFGQTNIDRLDHRRTIEQELLSVDPLASRTAVRGLAGLLMFTGALAEKPIRVLSGGERSRVLLGKLLMSPSNLLLLDEPTNHLDIESIEGLLDAIDAFPGALLIVTHSEMILERLCTRLIVFDGGRTTLFEGGYKDFLERIGWQSEANLRSGKGGAKGNGKPAGQGGGGQPAGGKAGAKAGGAAGGKPAARPDPKELRRQRADIINARAAATAPLRKRIDQVEKQIGTLEKEVAEHDDQLAAAAEQRHTADLARLAALAKRKRAEIERLFGELETLSEELDRASASYDARLAALE